MNVNTKPLSWEEFDRGIRRLMGEAPTNAEHPQVAPLIEKARMAEPVQRKRITLAVVGEWLHSRARDLALVLIILGTFVAVFQGSLTSATLFGFSGVSAIAFALMPDALMIISASKMRGTHVSPVQRREAKISMYFSLVFSLLSNMIAALYITTPAMFTSEIKTIGAVAYHGVIVVFLWRAVETSTKTRQDAPSVRGNAKAPKASAAPAPKKPQAKATAKQPIKARTSKNAGK